MYLEKDVKNLHNNVTFQPIAQHKGVLEEQGVMNVVRINVFSSVIQNNKLVYCIIAEVAILMDVRM